jgi:hypothetical protein
MAMGRIQFLAGLSLPEFIQFYGTEEDCEAALEQARWPDGLRCPRCECKEYRLIHAGATSAINAGAAVIRPPSPPAPSWR